MQPESEQGTKPVECERAARLCCQRSVHLLQFLLRVQLLLSSWMAQTSLFPPVAKSLLPSREADLGLRARLGTATGPTWCRFSTTLVLTSDGFLPSRFERRAASLNVGCLLTCLILAACVWCIKIHERCWSGCQGLWQRSSSAQVLRGECWGRLQRDGRGRWDEAGKEHMRDD